MESLRTNSNLNTARELLNQLKGCTYPSKSPPNTIRGRLSNYSVLPPIDNFVYAPSDDEKNEELVKFCFGNLFNNL